MENSRGKIESSCTRYRCVSPVALFAYNRPELTRQALREIEKVDPPLVFFVCDGPKLSNDSDLEKVNEVRHILDSYIGGGEIVQIYSRTNLGLRERTLSALDRIFEIAECAIIIEDDSWTSPSFFEFADGALRNFKSEPRIAMVSGNTFQLPPCEGVFFVSQNAYVWGWATWRDRWQEFRSHNLEVFIVPSNKKKLRKTFGSIYLYAGFSKIVKDRLLGKNDSWSIYFASYIRLASKFVVQPTVNLVGNLGFGSDSTHTKFESFEVFKVPNNLASPLTFGVPRFNLKEIKKISAKEGRERLFSWVKFVFVHPIDFAKRLRRYLGKQIA